VAISLPPRRRWVPIVATAVTAVVVLAVIGVALLLSRSGPAPLDAAGDPDRDGLTTGRERSLGSDPQKADTDGDALPDGVEVDQKRYDLSLSNPPLVDLDLNDDNASDANPLVKDVFVEVDRMGDYRLNFLAIGLALIPLRDAPGGRIVLHVDQNHEGGETVPSQPCLGLSPTQYPAFRAIKQAHFNATRKGVYHYAILANLVGDPPCAEDVLGQALGDDDDFLLAFERLQFGGESQQAAVFLHELGHNLGLLGNRYEGVDNLCTLPGSTCFDQDLYSNYQSVMNYRFQRGFGGGGIWTIDYSDGTHGSDRYGHPDHNDWAALRFDVMGNPD